MGRKKKAETNPDEAISNCTCPKCGSKFQVAVRALGPKAVRPPDPRQLPFEFVRKNREHISLSEILGDE